jgi:hypothetical protein
MPPQRLGDRQSVRGSRGFNRAHVPQRLYPVLRKGLPVEAHERLVLSMV